ncbi:MAG: InlB B-repeat-containing protein [Faecalibacterium sp.]|uniref:InlB B-repeat-containing protein n=1 Tax=Faecalibacterium sp. TaxID=1971605 RepID=UPI00399A84B9
MRKKSTRLLSAALAVCMTVTVLPMSAFASGEEELKSDVSPQKTTAEQSEETGGVTGDVVINEAFPDQVFREFVKQYDNNNDGKLSQDELAAVTEMDLDPYDVPYDKPYRGEKISSLKGIEHFTSLKNLNCKLNLLTELDVSQNPALESLDCSYNQLRALDVSNNLALKELNCCGSNNGSYKLSALDVSNCPALEKLNCKGNELSTLDVSKNSELNSLNCGDNKLSALNVSNNSKLTILGCWDNKLSELDLRNNSALEQLTCYSNQLSELDVSQNEALKLLNCGYNLLSELNVSQNLVLEALYCDSNQLSELDVSQNKALEGLICRRNQLSALDLSNNQKLSAHLYCDSNQLTSLNLGERYFEFFSCNGNSYDIVVDETNCYDLSKLPGKFDASKVMDLHGGTLDKENNILTVDKNATEITYTYNCGTYINSGNIIKAKCKLNVTHHTHHYGDWLHDEAYHWHECTDHDCPEPEESVKDKAEHTFDDNAKDKDCNTCGYVRPLYTVTTDNAAAKLESEVEELKAPVAAGTEVILTAGDAPEGKTFAGWKLYKVVSDTESQITDETELANLLKNGTETTATLTMPAYNVKAEPYYSNIPYNITPVNCTVDKTEASMGDTVTATRRALKANERFTGWTVKVDGVEQDPSTFLTPDASDPTKVTFTMPDKNVEVKANFASNPTLNPTLRVGDHVTATIEGSDASVPSGSTVPVPKNKIVHLTATAPGQHFISWTVKVNGVEQDPTFLKPDADDPTKVTFIMPDANVEVTATFAEDPIPEPDPVGPSDTGNIQGAISAVVVGAAAGAIIYEAGTGIYRVINMPGIPMPSNRIELAELLWEHAGKPEPVSTARYSDIDEGDTDAQKAARWAVEQDLMKDDADNNKFHPAFPVSKLRTCLTWNAAKEKGLFDKTEE